MKTYTNKNTSLMTSEGASAPGITKRNMTDKKEQTGAVRMRGSVTIEASVGIPLFLFASVCLIWMIEVQSIRISILTAAQSAAKSAAEDTAILPVLNTIKLKKDIISFIGEDRINRSIIQGGTSGISCWKSHVSLSSKEISVTVRYKIQLPLPLFNSPSAELEEHFIISAWTGYQGGRNENDAGIVYVTDNEAVYHEEYGCSYLQLSIRFVPASELEMMRNEGGGRYHACDKCVFGTAMTGVYITGTGNKYHNSLNCSGLKRTIHAVEKSEVSGIGGCSRCSGKK